MIIYKGLLKEREGNHFPINIAVIGAGWFGRGLIRELCRWPTIEPRLVIDRTIDKAIGAFLQAGVSKDKIRVVNSVKELNYHIREDKYIISSNLEILKELESIDVIFEATGDIGVGAKTAMWAIKQGIHFITAGSEMDATVGLILNQYAEEKNLIYSNTDGDQPGVLSRMITEVKLLGFDIVVAGNCKGYIDYHKTPDDILPWVRKGHNSRKVTSFTDGSKQSLELAALANATGLMPDKRGMHGPKTTKQTLVEDFLKVISREGIVDYSMGITGVNQGAGVFVIGKRDNHFIFEDMDYLKKGKGPYYLFFRDHHLCYFEAPKTIVEAVLFNAPTLAPKYKAADVFAVAKRDLKAGEKLDGIGGYTVYGLIDQAAIVREENLLPIGLTEYAVLKRNIKKDMPLTHSMVDFPEDNLVLRLRKQQDGLVEDRKQITEDREETAEIRQIVG